jgi:hypothetical protein
MKKEKGQALPLALVALTIGALLVAPFLGHASSSMIGSREYGSTIDYRNACDAGIEHAIWSLIYSNLADLIPEVGNQYTYQLTETINGVTPTITITTNASGIGGTTGNITQIIDNYKFEPSIVYETDIFKVADTIYAIASRGPSNKGDLRTVTIADNGTITHSCISSLQFDSSTCYTPEIIHISGTTYAIVYRGSNNRGYLKTMNIADNGIISQTIIDTLMFDYSAGYEPSIVQVSGNVYAIAYRGFYNRGYLKTVTIEANGAIGDVSIDTLIFDYFAGYEPEIIQTTGSIFAIAYRGWFNLGMLATVNIAANGDIGSSTISSLVTDTALGLWPDIIKVSDTIYADIFTCIFDWPDLKTANIAEDGTISEEIIGDEEYEDVLHTPRIIHIAGNIYMICGRTTGNNGIIRTVEIAPDGTIPIGNISTFTFVVGNGFDPDIIKVSSNVVAITHHTQGNSGYVLTVGLVATGANIYRIDASAGNTTITAYVTISGTPSILSWQLE